MIIMARKQEAHRNHTMNTILKTVLTLFLALILLGHAEAGQSASAESPANSEPGVVVKVGQAIEHGVRTAAGWVEHGFKAAAGGVERGAKATANGIKHGAAATARGVEHGAKATENAAGRVADKIDKSPRRRRPQAVNKGTFR